MAASRAPLHVRVLQGPHVGRAATTATAMSPAAATVVATASGTGTATATVVVVGIPPRAEGAAGGGS